MTDQPDDQSEVADALLTILKELVDAYGASGVLNTLYGMHPDLRPVPVDVPPSFYWNMAHDLAQTQGAERAAVTGLSIISEQLDFIAKKMTE
jgi:hypothetical protein